jgi:hypothetical protein
MSSESCSAPVVTLGWTGCTLPRTRYCSPDCRKKDIRKPALFTVRPASEREQDSRKRDNERDQLKSQSEQSGGYDRLDDHRLLTWINHCSFFYANLEYLASLGSRT